MAILLLREVLLATRTEHEKCKPLYSLPRIAAVTTLRQPLLRFAIGKNSGEEFGDIFLKYNPNLATKRHEVFVDFLKIHIKLGRFANSKILSSLAQGGFLT